MRLLLFLLASLFPVALPVFAQDTVEGAIRYDRTRQVKIELPPEMAHMADQIPTSNTTPLLLRFTEMAAVTTVVEEEKPDRADQAAGGTHVQMSFFGGNSKAEDATFVDLETGEVVEKTAFLGRTFLITGEEKVIPWKLTGEQSDFLGYRCQKATATLDSTTFEAWFTSEVPVAMGPDGYGGLPGAILVLSLDEGDVTYTATAVELAPLGEDNAVVRPEGGQAVTRDEYRSIVKERVREMQEERGGGTRNGGSTFIIRSSSSGGGQ